MSFKLPGVLLLSLLLALAGTIAHGADDDAPTASRNTFLKLVEVQELWEEERYDDALSLLGDLADKVSGRPYDFVVVHQYMAHTAIVKGDTALARRALETALPMVEQLPLQTQGETKLFYGQVMLGEEEYEIARQAFDDWLATSPEKIKPGQLFSAAYAHFRTGNMPKAENLVVRAIEGTTKVEENWERLYYQVLFEQEKYDEAEELLVRMLARVPSEAQRWKMLANHYLRLEDSKRALATMVVTDAFAPLNDPEEQERLVSLYSYLEVPERAARILADGLESGKLEEDPDSLRQLGNLWMLAREREKAKVALHEAAAVAPDGRTWELLGGLHFEDEQWESAYEAFVSALNAGGLGEPHRVSLLAGLSALNAGMDSEAREALKRAAQEEELKGQAEALLKRIGES